MLIRWGCIIANTGIRNWTVILLVKLNVLMLPETGLQTMKISWRTLGVYSDWSRILVRTTAVIVARVIAATAAGTTTKQRIVLPFPGILTTQTLVPIWLKLRNRNGSFLLQDVCYGFMTKSAIGGLGTTNNKDKPLMI